MPVLSQERGQLFPEGRIVVRDEELHGTLFWDSTR
jgi:hypothetical protein